eukprot:TRINITY_DN13639_c0_g1_i1.p1 TRINITY_DN13639_c0_g1~~TRINITY_DN13639_c0_g1_i1.p1  ORF type:complete len:437 (-),score=67.83 TRINITY_DN13639_c0_g1_i1:213-1523(-)
MDGGAGASLGRLSKAGDWLDPHLVPHARKRVLPANEGSVHDLRFGRGHGKRSLLTAMAELSSHKRSREQSRRAAPPRCNGLGAASGVASVATDLFAGDGAEVLEHPPEPLSLRPRPLQLTTAPSAFWAESCEVDRALPSNTLGFLLRRGVAQQSAHLAGDEVAGAALGGGSSGSSNPRLASRAARSRTSFIKRCWFSGRGCLESSECSSLRFMFKDRKIVDKYPIEKKDCKSPLYIVTGSTMPYRNGFIDEGRPESVLYPGEKWEKCCRIKGKKPTDEDSLICEKTEVVDKGKLYKDWKGYCGKKYCMNAKDRCLKLEVQKETLKEHAAKERCPKGCDDECEKSIFSVECIYTGVEPKVGEEGEATPEAGFGEFEKYQVFSLGLPLPALALPLVLRHEGLECGSRESCGSTRSGRTSRRCCSVSGRYARWADFLMT